LNMAQAQVHEYRFELERVSRELTESRRKYYELRRKESVLRQKAAEASGRTGHSQTQRLAETQRSAASQAVIRFAGGGFNTQM
jgi:hypothetical protein